MSKKLVVKLLATVMAMSMVMGSGLTVFADSPHTCGTTDQEGWKTDAEGEPDIHTFICGSAGCTFEKKVACGSSTYLSKKDENEHSIKCITCDKEINTQSHVADTTSYYYDEERGHAKWCTICKSYFGDFIPCQYEIKPYYDGNGVLKHAYVCTICYRIKDNTFYDHDTNGENGTCSACGYDPNLVLRGHSSDSSSSSKKEKDERIKETSVSSSTPKVDAVEEMNKALAKQIEETIKAEESIPVTSFASTAAVNAVPAEVKATATAGATYNLSQITTTQGFVAAVNKIAEANPGATSVTVYSSNPMAFSADVLTAVSNANKELVYTFNHKGHLYKITIPAGAKIDLNGNRYAGPLYIGAQLGTSVVLK